MLDAIMNTLQIMGWLGLVYIILVVVNIVSGTLANIWSQEEEYSSEKMFKGISKALVFYISAVFIGIAFTMLPFINEMIVGASGEMLLSKEMLDTLSSVGVLGVIISAIVVQGKKAIENIIKLSTISNEPKEEITWTVIEDEEEE